jgi:hypothetical protein
MILMVALIGAEDMLIDARYEDKGMIRLSNSRYLNFEYRLEGFPGLFLARNPRALLTGSFTFCDRCLLPLAQISHKSVYYYSRYYVYSYRVSMSFTKDVPPSPPY